MSALKPCPFCGSQVICENDVVGHSIDAGIDCPLAYNAFPLAEWNTRTDTSADRIVALEEGLRDCATRFRRCVIAGGTAEEYADAAVERYTALLTHTEGSM